MASMKANFHPSEGQQIEIITTEIRCRKGIGPRKEPEVRHWSKIPY